MANARQLGYDEQFTLASEASVDARANFLVSTYMHLAGAVVAFGFACAVILTTPALRDSIIQLMFSSSFSILLFMLGFMGVTWLASSWAQSSTNVGQQYLGLGLYVIAEAVIFTPILYIAHLKSAQMGFGNGIIETAALVTALLFAAMTSIVVVTRKDFSFMGPALTLCGLASIGLIICSMIFGFSLGIFFTTAMIAFACCYILYDTSVIMNQYAVNQPVAAALALFASVAMLFFYVLRLLISLQNRD